MVTLVVDGGGAVDVVVATDVEAPVVVGEGAVDVVVPTDLEPVVDGVVPTPPPEDGAPLPPQAAATSINTHTQQRRAAGPESSQERKRPLTSLAGQAQGPTPTQAVNCGFRYIGTRRESASMPARRPAARHPQRPKPTKPIRAVMYTQV